MRKREREREREKKKEREREKERKREGEKKNKERSIKTKWRQNRSHKTERNSVSVANRKGRRVQGLVLERLPRTLWVRPRTPLLKAVEGGLRLPHVEAPWRPHVVKRRKNEERRRR